MKSKLKKIMYLVIGLLIAFLPNNTLIFNNIAQNELSIPKQSAGYIESFIYVDGNWSDTRDTYDWCSGDGSWSTPFTIENVSINAISSPTGSGILINNSLDVYFNIRNCTIFGSGSGAYDAGIKLVNVTNGKIFNNTCSNNLNDGILLMTDCNNNTVADNIANNNGDGGIYLLNNCYENIISNNTVNNNDVGIILIGTSGIIGCDHNEILNNTAIYNGVGIWLSQSGFNTVYGNSLVNNSKITSFDTSGNGIRISYYNWGGQSINNTIENNQILSCRYGIFMYDGVSNMILNNTINNNTLNGIYMKKNSFPCENNTIKNNTVNYNKQHGIYLQSACNNNNITENTANDNKQHGIYLQSGCGNNTITENTINDNTDAGIYLISSCDNNIIKNNTINRNHVGITLYQSNYNNISGNILKDNSFCIYETNSVGNIIEYNDCSPPTVQEPIFIKGDATGVGANNWTWAVSQSWCSGSGTWNDPYIIENLKISGFGAGYGIYIYNSNVSFIIQDCLIVNSHEGIYLENVNNSRLINNNCSNIDWGILLERSNNNTISGNTANGNIYEGIYLTESMVNTLSGNTANDNGDSGIHLDTECMGNTLSGNIANSNSYGIYIYDYCSNNTISGNTANDNDDTGIYLEYYCSNNNISGNIANSNNFYGILLYDSCSNNTISGNTANDNNYGIYLEYDCINNNISGNIANDNDDTGIYLESECDYNNITENILYNNTIGVYIDSQSDNNSIYKNFFLENGIHAIDDGTDTKWNSTTIGNYWDNHTGPDVSPNDGIVDGPYTFIGGFAGSIDYLPIAEDGAPSITINSPTSSDVFGATAPSFDVTITDDYLDEMWYTLDGGSHNYTFIENGIINQTAWAAKTEGSVTITFYASDIPKNIGIAEVSIVKDTTAPIIVINSPTDGGEFGTQAPLFNITVTDDHLDSIWYSFDGGATTFAIINNTVFNQTAWTALPEGDVTITFYARDLAGNEAFEAVTVLKIAAGLDPGIIITIVVVSIAGGVAVAAVIFIYLKKRASP